MIKKLAKSLLFGLAAISASHAASPEGYSIETIETPPSVRFHVSGLDVAKDGTVYCATRYGDVWSLKNDKWTKFEKCEEKFSHVKYQAQFICHTKLSEH